jgi:hypothetical protein
MIPSDDELWEMYEGYDNQTLLSINNSESIIYWKEELKRNIDWLLDMDVVEWNKRIEEANKVALENRGVIEGYLFKHSLSTYI